MYEFFAGDYDVAVIGAGHAGIEAAPGRRAAGAEDGRASPSILTRWAICPATPPSAAPGKGHLVRELDALGGEMARAADALPASSTAC